MVRTLDASGAPVLHLDVMDGRFVPPITFGSAYIASLRPCSRAIFEVHLMVESPESQFEAMKRAGCDRVLFHIEATRHGHRLAQAARDLGLSPGVALNPGTPAEAIQALVPFVDQVLVMTVDPGWGGQKFIAEMMDKVSAIREWAGPELRIEVDGGIDRVTLPLARAAGANVFVVGSHLASAPDLATETTEMLALCK